MIKINLALRKQAVGLEAKDKGASLSQFNLAALQDLLKQPQVRKLGLAIIAAVMASYLLDGYKEDQIKRVDQQMQKVAEQTTKAKAELAKTSGYDALKKQFDADEEMIKTKLTTIQKLIADRQVPPKLLTSFSESIPKDVWLSELDILPKSVGVKGYSLGFDPITDFMKSLGDNELLTDVKLKNSQNAKDPIAGTVATFELEAKRK